jgi:hypothetical protein
MYSHYFLAVRPASLGLPQVLWLQDPVVADKAGWMLFILSTTITDLLSHSSGLFSIILIVTTADDILTDLLSHSHGLPSSILTTIRISTFCDLNQLINLQRQD